MKRIPVFAKITFKLYLLLIAIYTAFRVALLLLNLVKIRNLNTITFTMMLNLKDSILKPVKVKRKTVTVLKAPSINLNF